MRILAIGDIHGCATAFDTLLAAVQPQPDDLIITLGDYVDRGPDSKAVIERLLSLHKTGRLVALRGNHEIMMLQARIDPLVEADWRSFGGDEALDSYVPEGHTGTLADVPATHWDFIENVCVAYHETDTHFFVHANAHPKLQLIDQPDFMLYWERFNHPDPHCSGKIMVCGHTSQKSGLPVNLGHAVCIDTWVYGRGSLTCLNVTTSKIWQANEAGEQRTFSLHDIP